MEHLEEEMTCSICLSVYDDPRILQCSHSFCRKCLENLIRSSDGYLWRLSMGRLKCPACRGTTDVLSGVHSLPVNFALKAIVEKYKSNHQTKTCAEHSRHQLNMFCLKDRKLICGQCLTVGPHKGHPVEDPDVAYTKEQQTASRLFAALSDKNFTGVSSVIRALEEQMTNCKNIVLEDKKEVLVFFDNLIEVLEQKKQDFLSSLNDLNQQVVDVFAPQIEEMKQIRDEELDLASLCSSAQTEESPLVYLETIHDIQQRMMALKKQQLLPIRPVELYPRVGEIFKDKWLKSNTEDVPLLPIPKFAINFQKREHRAIQSSPQCNWILVAFLLFISFISLFIYFSSVIPSDFTTRYRTCLSEIMGPALHFGESHVKTVSHRFSSLYLDFIAHLHSLLKL
ncbi:tripartite motif-containing protein 59 [Bufo bufo]|uniref:tripartite motif-containing protein 59 n=1 Tax=Bufo bufo TaxID=8384 RepID=UPI001ABE5770|nr:tripartite motif-containing protein 59 [Bufo bufo]XP_040286996.1 tripartite motif-containing protein 59 [Bufo bufo]XP_040286997.1 tripartite motif-containing protein 59 [Bufo bufo]